ncbi:MAG: hypothetical protein ACRC6V_09220 [Bacteroidales bacterium]
MELYIVHTRNVGNQTIQDNTFITVNAEKITAEVIKSVQKELLKTTGAENLLITNIIKLEG